MAPPVVIKIGGGQLVERAQVTAIVKLVIELREQGRSVVLVHGGDLEISALHDRLGVAHRKELGLRVTSDESLEIVTMVLCGLINPRLVAGMTTAGVPAMGLSGIDLGLMRSTAINEQRLGRVGGPPRVDGSCLDGLLADGIVVVLSPVCLGPDGQPINVNGDVVAQEVAVTLGADRLDFVTDVDELADTRQLSSSDVEALLAGLRVGGGMIPKLHAVLAALDGGVTVVRIGTLRTIAQGTATEVHPSHASPRRRAAPRRDRKHSLEEERTST